MASEYRTALPNEKELAAEIERTQVRLQSRKSIALASSEVDQMEKDMKKTKKKPEKQRQEKSAIKGKE